MGGEHRVAAVALLVVAVVLVTVDDDLVADFPALYLVTDGPNDAGRIGAGNVVGAPWPSNGLIGWPRPAQMPL
jgi:hypothetical protein